MKRSPLLEVMYITIAMTPLNSTINHLIQSLKLPRIRGVDRRVRKMLQFY